MTNTKEIPEFISINGFCKRLKCAYPVWHKLVESGEAPPHYKLSTLTRIPVASFEKWLQEKVTHPNIDV